MDLRGGIKPEPAASKLVLWNCPAIHLHIYQGEIRGIIGEKNSAGYRGCDIKGMAAIYAQVTGCTGEKSASSAMVATYCGTFSV